VGCRRSRWIGRGGELHHALVEHGVGDFDEAGDVGTADVVDEVVAVGAVLDAPSSTPCGVNLVLRWCRVPGAPDYDRETMSHLTLRLPDSLHQQLVARSKTEGVSLNQLIVYLLTRTTTVVDLEEQRRVFDQLTSRYPPEEAEEALRDLLAART